MRLGAGSQFALNRPLPERLDRCTDAFGDSWRVQPNFTELFLAGGVGDHAVGHAQASEVFGRESMRHGMLDDRGAEAVLQRMIFEGEDDMVLSQQAREHGRVERLAEAGIDHADARGEADISTEWKEPIEGWRPYGIIGLVGRSK